MPRPLYVFQTLQGMRKVKSQFVAVVLCASCGALARAQCTLPAVPGAGTPDSTFDQFFTQNGPGWTGADGTFSLVLPDGRNLWMWSDSYIGTVDPITRLRSSYLFTAHNSLTIQEQSTNTLTTVGYPPKTSSYFVPKQPHDWFWVGDGVVVQPSPGVYKIVIMLLEWTGVFHFVGNSVTVLSWPSLSIDSIQPVALPDTTIEWGAKLLPRGTSYYIYGIRDPGTANKLPYVARIKSIYDLTNPSRWQYWNSTTNQWMAGQSNATPLVGVPAITNEYTVNQLTADSGPFYLMVGMEPQYPAYPGWKYITTHYACNPQGPWQDRTIVYTTPETGAAGCRKGNLFTYDPRAHPEFSGGDTLLISYNVNAIDSTDLACADDYKPRFIRVSIPGLMSRAQSRQNKVPLDPLN